MKTRLVLLILALASCQRASQPSLVFEPEPAALVSIPARDPKLVVRASGAIFALVAERAPEGGLDARLYRSEDGGNRFGEPLTLNALPGEVSSHGEAAPKLLLGPRSELYAFWVGKGALRFSRSTNYGKSFEPPVKLPVGSDLAPTFFTAEVSPDGALLVAWLGQLPAEATAPGTSLLLAASSSDRGATFSAPSVVARSVCPCCRPALAGAAKGTWFVAWRQVTEGQVRDLVAARSSDGGKRWSDAVPVSNDGWKLPGCPHSGPALAIAGQSLHVAWFSEGEGSGRVYWTRSPIDALTFAPRRELSSGIADANHPSLAVAGDEVLAAFQGRDAKDREGWGPIGVFVRRLSSSDEPALRVPGGPESASYPELLSTGAGKWLVAWTASGEAGPRIFRARARSPR